LETVVRGCDPRHRRHPRTYGGDLLLRHLPRVRAAAGRARGQADPPLQLVGHAGRGAGTGCLRRRDDAGGGRLPEGPAGLAGDAQGLTPPRKTGGGAVEPLGTRPESGAALWWAAALPPTRY